MIDEKKLIEEIKYLLFNSEMLSPRWFAINEMLEIIKRQPEVGEWIPSSERLPEEKESVLVQWEKYDRYLNITTTYLDVMWLDDAEEKVFETINGVPNGKVVAWQPLPEPWEGENE